jgi:hypothetical protein
MKSSPRDESLPERVEAIIRAHELKLTEELRKLTGRDDITATFDREQFLGWPEPAPLPTDYWESAE